MSSKMFKKENSKLASDFFKQNDIKNPFLRISDAVVSFLNLSKKDLPEYLYPEGINAPFKELDSEFKCILKQEFADAIKKIEN